MRCSKCWGSLWTERAISYRTRLGIDSAEVRIAVVVQPMINAEVAGVMFTADPVSGDRETIMIDASIGLGEAVVSGLVTPDHYVLDDQGRIREFHPGDPDRTQRLPDPVLAELARLGLAVAKHFGRPQDIEWAYAEDKVWLLQARPMTALPPPPIELNAAQRRLGSVLLDYLPVRPYPIDMTHLGAVWPSGPDGRVTGRFGIRDAFEGFLPEDEYGVVDRFVPVAPRPTLGVLRAPWRIATLARRYNPAQLDRRSSLRRVSGRSSRSRSPRPDDDAMATAQGHAAEGARPYQADRRSADRLPAAHRARVAPAVSRAALAAPIRAAGGSAGRRPHPDHRRQPSPRGARHSRSREFTAARNDQQTRSEGAQRPSLSSRRSSTHISLNTATARPSPRSWSRRPPKARRRRPYWA